MKMSVIVATYNRSDDLQKTIKSIRKFSNPQEMLKRGMGYEIIVVDDGSSIKHAERNFAIAGQFDCVYVNLGSSRSKYLGPAYPMNKGAMLATGEILVFNGTEIVHQKNNLEIFGELDTRTAMFARVVNQLKNGTLRDEYTSIRNTRPFFFLGAVHKCDFDEINGFDESYLLPGYEDDNLAARMCHSGMQMTFNDNAIAFHIDHPRTGDWEGGFTANAAKYADFVEKCGGRCWRLYQPVFKLIDV